MITIDNDKKLAYIKGRPINLTKLEFNILYFFMSNPEEKVFSREDLIDNIWTTTVSNRTVDVNITRLRKKLGKYGKFIQTRKGFGYFFSSKVA